MIVRKTTSLDYGTCGSRALSRNPTLKLLLAQGYNPTARLSKRSITLLSARFQNRKTESIIPQEWLDGVDLAKRVVAIKRGKKRFTYTYRWIEAVPLRDGDDAMTVNWLEIAIADAAGEVTYRNSFVTDLPVNADNVVEIAAAGRARWKIENGSFNVLKTKGYNLEHNFGHGKDNLAAVLVTLNLLAFLFIPSPNAPRTFGIRRSRLQAHASPSPSCATSRLSSCFPHGRCFSIR
jgi:hypothetical protein